MRKGLTLIEITIVIALMGILVATYFLAANPGGQLAASRNTQRSFELQAIMNAVRQNIADSPTGQFQCVPAGTLPTSTKRMMSGGGVGTYDIASCLVPTYILVLPFDPSAPGAHYAAASDYDTGFSISINASTSVVTISAPYAELGKTISVSR